MKEKMITKLYSVSENDIKRVMLKWEVDSRLGNYMTREQVVALSAEEVAKLNTETFFKFLQEDNPL